MATDRLPFGTRVTVAATVKPRYLRWDTTRTVYDDDGSGMFLWGREEQVDPPVLVNNDTERSDDIGEPLEGASDVPEKGIHRRLRRFSATLAGVVVGWVWRVEGEYWGPSGGHDYYTGEYDHDPGGLAETRRVKLYQVAIDPGEVGQQFHPACIVLGHPDDVRPMLTEG